MTDQARVSLVAHVIQSGRGDAPSTADWTFAQEIVEKLDEYDRTHERQVERWS